ncbi:MAG TPA: nucleotidyltransferase domain-containing protein [Vicinamibacterales bacterium]|nr:nucleotidyltransferase domain-containing protein [Vicinamibacterales bacterium]
MILPANLPAASGRFLLRTGEALHQALRSAARAAGLSLNEYCVTRLSAPAGSAASPDAAAVVEWVEGAFGGAVAGVVLYGSWTRGEATSESDVDLLIVLDASQPLQRELYRRCDTANLAWDGHPLQAQVVHLPEAGVVRGGLWPEIALDGIVLVERDLLLSRRLVEIRRAIVEGRLVRRTAHGQPYWTARDAA